MRLLLLMLGGALGTGARYALNGVISGYQTRVTAGVIGLFPLGTLSVNVSGCFLIGLLSALVDPSFGRVWIRPEWRDFLMIGFCGGFTTFSSYGVQTFSLGQDGEWLAVALNVAASNILGLTAVYAGQLFGFYLQSKGGAL